MSRSTIKTYPDGVREVVSNLSFRSLIAQRLYLPIAIGVIILGGIFGALGVVLVYLGATGDTHLKLFGQSVETASVGVASIFIGAVTVIVVLKWLLKSAEELSRRPTTKED